MDETDYWSSLEYRLCREFNGIEQCRELRLWCDGFIPLQYELDVALPSVRGVAWICPGQDQQRWEFTLRLNQRPTGRENIDWDALLPAEGVTQWLALDFRAKHIEMVPGEAVADTT